MGVHGREEVALFLSKRVHEGVVDYREVSAWLISKTNHFQEEVEFAHASHK